MWWKDVEQYKVVRRVLSSLSYNQNYTDKPLTIHLYVCPFESFGLLPRCTPSGYSTPGSLRRLSICMHASRTSLQKWPKRVLKWVLRHTDGTWLAAVWVYRNESTWMDILLSHHRISVAVAYTIGFPRDLYCILIFYTQAKQWEGLTRRDQSVLSVSPNTRSYKYEMFKNGAKKHYLERHNSC